MSEKVALLEDINKAAVSEFRDSGLEVVTFPKSAPQDEISAVARDAELLGVRSGPEVPRETIEACDRLAAIGCFCAGTSHVDTAAANEYGVAVFNSLKENSRSVAEHVIGVTFGLLRRSYWHNHKMHNGEWTKTDEQSHEVYGKTIGIVGCGAIGNIVSKLAHGVGMNVVYYDINPDAKAHKSATRAESLEELLAQSDVVTLHVSSNEHTKGMIDEAAFAHMRDGSYLINAARADVVDEQDMQGALVSGKLAGAALDVFTDEPTKRGNRFHNWLQGASNVFFTPHIGGSTIEAQTAIGQVVASKLVGYLATGSTVECVNLPQIDLGPVQPGTQRVLNIHRNEPGVLGNLAGRIGDAGLNIVNTEHSIRGDIGYAAFDIEGSGVQTSDILGIYALKDTIKTRLLSPSAII